MSRRDRDTTVVALVPAKDRADTVGATVHALLGLALVDRVLVIDDGSGDDTESEARRAGAQVLRLPTNRGKGGAVAAGVEASPDADVYLLIDADLGATAAAALPLLEPVLAGDADMTVAVLPPAGRKGGFGFIRGLAHRGIRRASGYDAAAPLSGQRAVRAGLLRGLTSAERFGLEVALTVDAVRAGARVVEVELPMDHRHTGRSVAGMTHRGRQGSDVVRALWPRLTSARARIGIIAVATVVAILAMLVSSQRAVPTSVPPTAKPDNIVIVGIPGLGLDDLGTGDLPALDRITRDGAVAATSVRTISSRPSAVEAYASLGAGTRVRTPLLAGADQAYPADAGLEGSTAADVVARRNGMVPVGSVVVVGGASAVRSAGTDVSSLPGALGTALTKAGVGTGVVGSGDLADPSGSPLIHRPTAIALMDESLAVRTGQVSGDRLLVRDPTAPYGLRADPDEVLEQTRDAMAKAKVVLVDPGDTDRAQQYALVSSAAKAESARKTALRWTDAFVGRLMDDLDPHTLLLVVGMTPPTSEWALTPTMAFGAGVRPGYLASPSTKRLGLVTLTDLAPTVLDAFGIARPDGMIGAPLRYHPGTVDLGALSDQNAHAGARETVYLPMALTFIIVQALVYLLGILALSQGAARTRAAGLLRYLVVAFAAWPLATFVYRALPASADPGAAGQVLVWGLTAVIALLAMRARRHPLSPLAWVAAATVALIVIDVSTGARLQMSSILGYSPHTAARYTGLGNTAFAVLAACAIIAATVHVEYAPRRREAVAFSIGLLLIVLIADGAPTLGSDVGGIITLVPVFGLLAYTLTGRRISWKTVAIVLGVTVLAVAAATAIDLLRPAQDRTHLGRFVSDLGSGDSTFWTTISRKWSTNVRLFGRTIWTWMVPITSVFLIYVLVLAKGWQRLLPPRSALRAGVVGVVFAGLIGWLVNDSGVVVSALVFVYIGPFLMLLALDKERGDPVVLPPLAAGDAEGAPGAGAQAPAADEPVAAVTAAG